MTNMLAFALPTVPDSAASAAGAAELVAVVRPESVEWPESSVPQPASNNTNAAEPAVMAAENLVTGGIVAPRKRRRLPCESDGRRRADDLEAGGQWGSIRRTWAQYAACSGPTRGIR